MQKFSSNPFGGYTLCAFIFLSFSPLAVSFENWGTIEAGKLYRSKKLTSAQLVKKVKDYKIASILCLAECTDEEKSLSLKLGLKYFDLSVHIPDLEVSDLNEIVKVLKLSPKPLLVHCRKGADRTGLSAALYYFHFKKLKIKEAISKGLSLRYGHLGPRWTPRIYEVLDEYLVPSED